MLEQVLIFDYNRYDIYVCRFLFIRGFSIRLSLWNLDNTCVSFLSKGGKAFIDTLLPRLNPKNLNGSPSMPFMIEVCPGL